MRTHEVKAGETFWSISRLEGVSVANLILWNPTVDYNNMPIGTVLNLEAPVEEPEVPDVPTEPVEDWDDEIAKLQLDVGELQARPIPVDYRPDLAQLRVDLDILRSAPAPEDWSDEIQAVTDKITALENRPSGGAVVGLPGLIPFNTIAGTNNTAKIAKMNEINRAEQVAGGTMPSFVVGDQAVIDTTEPITMWSSLVLESFSKAPAREYTRRPTIKWNGPRGSSLFRFLRSGESQSGQGYPSDGSPRDGFVCGLQFSLSPGTHLIEPTATVAGKTLWYWTFHNIGVKDGESAWIGYGTGTAFMTGNSHFQSMTGKSVVDVGGSECIIGGNEGIGFGDTNVAPANAVLVRSKLEKSMIGSIMITGRKTLTPLELYGGRAVRVLGLSPDSQGSDPIYGAGIRITGGEGHSVNASCVKGVMSNPGAANGGAAANQGMIHISGGTQHTVLGTSFIADGRDTPAVAVVGTAKDVKVGLNQHIGFPGRARYIGAGKYATFIEDSTAQLV